MPISVDPDNVNNTHHLRLSDGINELGLILCDNNGNADKRALVRTAIPRSSLKTYTGSQKYSDLEPPWTTTAQDDFSGGRGQEDHDEDTTRFYDSLMAWSPIPKELMPSGQAVYTTGIHEGNQYWPWRKTDGQPINYIWYRLNNQTGWAQKLAHKFTTTSLYAAAYVHIIARPHHTHSTTQPLSIEIWSDITGSPGTRLDYYEYYMSDGDTTGYDVPVEVCFNLLLYPELTASTDYWLVVTDVAGDATDYWEVLTAPDGTAGTSKAYYITDALPLGWHAYTSSRLIYRITGLEKSQKALFFEHKNAFYAVVSPDGESARVLINGDAGVATANSTINRLYDSTKTWTTDEWAGSIVYLTTGGQADSQTPKYRRITANTAIYLTVSPNWDVIPTTSTEYVIIGSDKWHEVGINDSGTASAGANTSLTDATKTWSTHALEGKTVRIDGGTGLGQSRVITHNDGTSVTVATWTTNPDNTSEYKILNHAFINECTDVCVAHNIAYFARGISYNMIRMRAYNSSGTWTYEWANEDTAASFVEKVVTTTTEGPTARIYIAQNDQPAKLRKALAVWGGGTSAVANLVFGGPIYCGDQGEYINGLEVYGEGGHLFVLKDTAILEVNYVVGTIGKDGGTASGGTGTTLIDAGKTWTVNEWASGDYYVRILEGAGIGESRMIVSNTADTLTTTAWGETPTTTTVYEIYQLQVDAPTELLSQELKNAADHRNGAAHTVQGVYLMYSFHDGLERYFNGQMDDVGPNRDMGLPSRRRGNVGSLTAWASMYFAGIDTEEGSDWMNSGTNPVTYSSVLSNNGLGWHEIFRGLPGRRVRNIGMQHIEGNQPDRLWISVGHELVWVPVAVRPSGTDAPIAWEFFPFTYEGQVITSWYQLGMTDIEKYWHQIKPLVPKGFSANDYVDIDYKLENPEGAWSVCGAITDASTEDHLVIPLAYNTGKRIRFRLRVGGHNNANPPSMKALMLESVGRTPAKFATTITFRIADQDQDLLGNPDSEPTADDKFALLETWLASPEPVSVEAYTRRLDNRSAFVDPYSMRVLGVVKDGQRDREIFICQLTLLEIDDLVEVPRVRYSLYYFVEGTLAAGAHQMIGRNRSTVKRIIKEVHLDLITAPTGANLTVDIHANDVTIFTNTANRPVILAGDTSGKTTTIDLPDWDIDETLEMIIDTVGSGTAGVGLTVQVVFVYE